MTEFELMEKLGGHMATMSEKDRGALLYMLCDADNRDQLANALLDCVEGVRSLNEAQRNRVADWASKAHKRVRPFSAAAARSGAKAEPATPLRKAN